MTLAKAGGASAERNRLAAADPDNHLRVASEMERAQLNTNPS